MDPRNFMDVAHGLLGVASKEAHLRTSISRSYYAQFLSIRDRLIITGFSLPKTNEHRAIIDELNRRGQTKLGARLNNLRQQRRKADYEMDKKIIHKDATLAYRLAGEVEALSNHL